MSYFCPLNSGAIKSRGSEADKRQKKPQNNH